MSSRVTRAIAVVGVGAVLPDAPNTAAFWDNVTSGRYSISDVDPQRWDPALYYDPDPKAPDKTYSKIGGWVRDWDWDPLGWRLPIPPKVSDAMDVAQIWAVIAAREALLDYGYPDRPLDNDRTAVVLGNAMGGENQYVSALRINYPEYARELERAPSFATLDPALRVAILGETRARMSDRFPEITEDTMPGELANITAGRIANLFNFHGPNFTTDAACASAMASFDAAIAGLESHSYDAVLSGGVDANMGASSFVKFCRIGALSATGTRPYAEGADGFVMGEGAAVFLLKRLDDAEKDGDHIYAVLRGLAGSSDGKGRGITAPNPVGQRFAIERAWRNADSIPDTASYIEGHGTSTAVGDVVEADALSAVFSKLGLPPGSLPLGSVKSNIGHLKAAAGAAGMLKAVMALDNRVLPPSLHAERPNPNIDFERSPLFVNTELQDWKASPSQVRQAGVSAFGFGGTNFHAVFEEYIPGRIRTEDRKVSYTLVGPEPTTSDGDPKTPSRGALVVGDETSDRVVARLRAIADDAAAGAAPPLAAPAEADLRAPNRIAIDYGNADELEDRIAKAIKAIEADNAGMWKALRNQGIFRGTGSPPLVAFLYTGQGSQYVNMLETLRETEPIIASVIAEADRAMEPVLGKPLSAYIYAHADDEEAFKAAERELRKTEITQPAVLAVDAALTRLLAAYGIHPNMVMGHSLGEYGALEAAGALPFVDALEAVAGRGREMAHVDVPDSGLMAAVFAPLPIVEETLAGIDGYVVIANINSSKQAVIGGASAAVEEASEMLTEAGFMVVPVPVSHAFHTEIVAPASEPLQVLLGRLRLASPAIPLVANIDGEFYPMGPNVAPKMIDILGRQIASPVQFVKGLRTLYDAGCRLFVEVGPKKALHGFVEDVLGEDDDVIALFSNHPKQGDVVSFNQALCGLYAAGLGNGTRPRAETVAATSAPPAHEASPPTSATPAPAPPATAPAPAAAPQLRTGASVSTGGEDTYLQLGHLFADFLQQGYDIYSQERPVPPSPEARAAPTRPHAVVTGASLGLPGSERVFTSDGIPKILGGEVLIDAIPVRLRQEMVDHHVTRLHKSEAGGGRFEAIDSQSDVIKLAGRGGEVDLVEEYGVPAARAEVLDRTSTLAIAAGLDALRDAGIPLVLRYKTTTTGTQLPERWMLPDAMRDDTGIIFASAFPGGDFAIAEANRFQEDLARRARLEELQTLRTRLEGSGGGNDTLAAELDHRIHEVEAELERNGYTFDRKYLFKALSMGHAQFAEYIGARGPNTQINGACASVPQAVAIAEDWISNRRCRRVVVISSDDVTSDTSLPWIGSGFLAVGAAATDEVVEDAATPFDRRRHGMILGMGAAAIVVEGADAAGERGFAPIADVLSTVTANSAFHGSRLDRDHIRFVMEKVIVQAEERWGIDRHEIAPNTVFVSHETYTPARGGSAQAEVDALRYVFGDSADRIVITNTKGFTGHAMATGIEDVVAIKTIETAIVPPIPNFKEEDPDLGHLNLSKGGVHPVRYALRLGAGFGSQISLTLYRSVNSPLGRHPEPDELGFAYRIADADAWGSWLRHVSGYESPELEVEGRTLRVRDLGPPTYAEPSAPVRERAAPAPLVPAASAPAVAETASPVPVTDAAAVEATVEDAAEPVGDPVHDRVLDIVAAETGYPPDMLDLDLDLEADLGIDTVKQAEMFAAIREEWGIERDDSVALRDYPTLQHVIEFVYERTDLEPAAATPAPAPTAVPATAAVDTATDLIRGDDTAAAAIPRRVPGAVLRPSLEMTRATRVVLNESSRVIVMADGGGVGRSLVRRLEERGVDVLMVEDSPAADDLLGRIDAWAADGGVTGVYWLPALDREDPITEMVIADWREALRVRVKLLYRTMRHLYDRVGGTGTFLLSATRLGGRHGYDGAPPLAPMGGGVTGFTKTYKREKPDALVKAVDFAPSRKTAALADTLIAETLRDPGAVEIGIDGEVRWTVGLTDAALPKEGTGLDLGPDSVFVVTGAAGSIVSAITADLAANSGGVFHLLDLVPEPDPGDPDIAAFSADKDTLKRTIFDRLKASGERATPAMVDKELARIERAHAALSAIRAVEEAGGTARYHSVNLLDAAAMATVTDLITATNDRVDVLLHAGGLEISRLLPDKEPDEYDLVFDVKADGWFNLLRGLSDVPIGATVAFSSIAGRFGNAGQADYSAANDLLCKWALGISAVRPETTGIAIDWTAWGDIGMATRGSIPTVMKAVGIDMLPAAAGIPIVRREVTAASGSREMVAGLQLGMLLEEWEEDGGVDLAALAAHSPDSPMSGRVTSFGINDGLTMVTTLDPELQPFLNDHRIDGTPVLPGVMGVEAFAAAALAGFPDRHVSAIEAVAFTAPFKFYRDESREATVKARFRAEGDEIVADCRLIGVRTIATQTEPQVTTHFTGRVRLGLSAPDLGTAAVPTESGPTVSADDIYRIYFHGPAYQVLDEAWRSDGAAVGRLAEDLPPNNIPAEQGTITDPRLLELCFQTAGVWEIGTTGQMALPMHIDRVVTMPASGSAEREYATMTASGDGAFVGSVVDRSGRVRVRLEGYLTVPLPGAIGAEDVAPLRAAMSDD